jgi:hypothetical protein
MAPCLPHYYYGVGITPVQFNEREYEVQASSCTGDEDVDVLLRDLGAQSPKVPWKSLHSPSQEGVRVRYAYGSLTSIDLKVDVAHNRVRMTNQYFYWMCELVASSVYWKCFH